MIQLRTLNLLLGLFLITPGFSQESPVKWNFLTKKVADNQYELHLIATIKPGWHIYSSNQPEGAIGLPTSIRITSNPIITLPGKIEERGDLVKVKSKVLDTEDYQYAEKVDFMRLIQLKTKAKTNVAGSVGYMACTNQKCLPPEEVSFSVLLN